MNLPLVSIAIPCYNHEQFVQDSIQGVIDQTYQNIELIIIDDGSSDGSVAKIEEMIEKCKERFTRFEFRNRPNKGLSATLNEALEWCEGKYYSTIASDDIMLSEKTKIEVDYLEKNNKIIGVFGGVEIINNHNRIISSFVPSDRELTFKNLYLGNGTIMAPTQLIRMKYIKMIGRNPYPEDVILEDRYMWLKLSQIGRLKNIQKKLVKYRIHDKNTMNNVELIENNNKYIIEMFKDSKHFDRAINLMRIEQLFRKGDKRSSFNYILKHPKLIIDYLTYKKLMLTIYLNISQNKKFEK